jgi:glycosyltransferase involved in cell wall biosynthesis
MHHRVVMVTTSYPRFPGDSVGTFMEPIAKGIATRGHEVHLVAPWHPHITRGREEDGVFFHFFKYAPTTSLNVFGYAAGLREDVQLRGTAWAVAPFAMTAGWFKAMRVAQKRRANIMHGHWVVPGGVIAAAARPRLPLVVSLHGSDMFVAERVGLARALAARVFRRAGRVTACSADLAQRAISLGADPDRIDVVPYGVDSARFAPRPDERKTRRSALRMPPDAPLLFTAGRLVRKKGFEHLIDAMSLIDAGTPPVLAIAGTGDLANELQARARSAGLADRVRLLGNLAQDEVAGWFAAADVAVVPSVHDDLGNVDGLPNTVLEALASATPLIATRAGGIGTLVEDDRTGLLVPERDAPALARAIASLLRDPARGQRIGREARAMIEARCGWDTVAERFETAYERALAFKSPDR